MKTKQTKAARLRVTAFHEAGHFVVGYVATGICADRLSIEREGDSLGHVSGEDVSVYRKIPDDLIEGEITSLFAGYAAHVRLCPDQKLLARRSAGSDFNLAANWFRQLKHSPTRRRRLLKRTHTLVRVHWASIEALAVFALWVKRKIGRGEIDGAMALTVIEAARGDEEAKQVLPGMMAMAWRQIAGSSLELPRKLRFLMRA